MKVLRIEEFSLRIEVLEKELAKRSTAGLRNRLKKLLGTSEHEKISREVVVAELEALREAVREAADEAVGEPPGTEEPPE
jgi:hypothetical protein